MHNCALQVSLLTRGAAHALTWALPALEAGEETRGGGEERSREGIQLCRNILCLSFSKHAKKEKNHLWRIIHNKSLQTTAD